MSKHYTLIDTENRIVATSENFHVGDEEFEPRVIEPVVEEPTQLDRIEAQVTYTAMMTDTILEV